jgi:shikimate kinase
VSMSTPTATSIPTWRGMTSGSAASTAEVADRQDSRGRIPAKLGARNRVRLVIAAYAAGLP